MIQTIPNKSLKITCFITAILLIVSCAPFCSNHNLSESRKLKIFSDNPQEPLQPTKWDVGDTTISNEHRLDLFKKKVLHLGGGYVGVGTTQNFTLAGWADSEWIWLLDFTRIAVAANKIHISFLKNAQTPYQFKKLWKLNSKDKAMKIIDSEYSDDPDIAFIKESYDKASPYVLWRCGVLKYITKKRKYDTWYTNRKLYDKIRALALKGHIIALKGDLNGTETLMGISKNSKRMGVTIKIIYLSNAEEYFDYYNSDFRDNIFSLPTDEKSVILRTTTIYKWIFPWAPDSEYHNPVGFHYNVMPTALFIKWLKENNPKLYVYDIMITGKVYGESGLSEITAFKPPESKKKKD